MEVGPAVGYRLDATAPCDRKRKWGQPGGYVTTRLRIEVDTRTARSAKNLPQSASRHRCVPDAASSPLRVGRGGGAPPRVVNSIAPRRAMAWKCWWRGEWS